jgi:putative acetyltransferase
VNVRDAVPGDSEAVREVHRRSIEGLGPAAYDSEQVAAWAAGCASADYATSIAETDAFLVAERDGVVGFGSLSLASPGEYEVDVDAEVTGVYVLPEVTREGVGSALYDALERRARSEGVGVLGLWASRNAVGFYRAKGYQRVRTLDHEFSAHEDTGVTGTVVEMVKPLADTTG